MREFEPDILADIDERDGQPHPNLLSLRVQLLPTCDMNKAAPLPAGSAPDSVKRTVLNLLTAVADQTHARGFVRHVLRRIVITELSLQPMVDSAKRQEWLL